jgi:putative ABC transport system permease protein
LARNPGFAAVAVLTLALGIGANAAIFSLVDAVILRPLPYPDPEQLVGMGQWRDQKGEGYIQTGVSAPNIADIAKTGVFQYVAYFRWSGFNITEGNRPESVDGIQASAELLPMFGVPPLLGRFPTAEEMEPGHNQVAVIGHRLWQMRYGSDPSILGKTIGLDQKRYTIVGVMPAWFRFTWDQEMDVFVPLVLTPEERSETGRGTSRDLQTQARLKAGWSLPQAQAAMNALADSLAREYPAADKGWGIKVEPLHAAYYRHMQTPLSIMVGAVLFVLLIACVNVANLLLARATGRKREVAIRVAMGATRRRLIAQLLTESLLLAVGGGALGLLLAHAGDRLLTLAMARYQLSLPNASVIDIDWRVLAFTLAVTMATGAIFGLAPAWAAAKTGLSESLKESGLSATAEPGRRRLRNALVVCEIALALVLLAGAGLLVRTFETGKRRPRHRPCERRHHEASPARLQVLGRVAAGGLLPGTDAEDREHTRRENRGSPRRRRQRFFPAARPAPGGARTGTDCELQNRDARLSEGHGNAPGGGTRVHGERQPGRDAGCPRQRNRGTPLLAALQSAGEPSHGPGPRLLRKNIWLLPAS